MTMSSADSFEDSVRGTTLYEGRKYQVYGRHGDHGDTQKNLCPGRFDLSESISFLR